jgi:hypothetical protein
MNSSDNHIPVLTEVISIDDATLYLGNAPSQHSTVQSAIQQPIITEPALEQLEKNLRETILRQLLTRIDFVLEHRIREGLADIMQTAVEGLAKEVRAGLIKSLEEVIRHAVNHEISKIRASAVHKP